VSAGRIDWGWTFFTLALALRGAWIIYNWTASGPALSYPDEELHWQLATNLVRDGSLVTDDGRYAARMPVYPLFLAFVAGLDQAGVLLARLTQAAVGATTVLIGCRLISTAFDRRAGFVAGLLLCCDPYAIFFANLLLTEVLFTFLAVSLTACAWVFLAQQRNVTSLVGVAVLGAAVIMSRPSATGWVPLLWLALWVASADRGRSFARLLLCGVVLAVLMLPWGLRNRAVLGSYAWLSANGGVTLFDAQGPQADGSSDQTFLAELPELDGLDEVARDQQLQRMALEQMRSDPGRVLGLAWVKFCRTWNPLPNIDQYRRSRVGLAGGIYTIAALVLAFVGLARALARRLLPHQLTFWRLRPGPRTFHALLWLPVIYFTLLHCVYVGSLRYRVPLMPFVGLAAATAFARPPGERSG
jgi:hypothetical protein